MGEQICKDDAEYRDRLFFQELESLLAARQSTFEQFDKAILTLSSGGLAVSLGFVQWMKGQPTAANCTLYISWFFFVTAIFSTLVSFLVVPKAIDHEIEFCRQHYREGQKNAWNAHHWTSHLTTGLNIYSAAAFIFAVTLTVIFVGLNLNRGAN